MYDKRNKEIYISFHFTTMKLPCFNIFRENFYKLNLKIIPSNIYDLLTPRALAFWIMDDGSLHGKGFHISTYNFSEEDNDKLLFVLQNKFNLICSIYYKYKNLEFIYLNNLWLT